jgi:glycosyltransferase involved in cell wall biosynthesis
MASNAVQVRAMKTESSLSPGSEGGGSAATGTISVVIPAYNAAAYLPDTLRSIAAQSLRPLEVVVVDDGSTDDTAAIARSFGVRVITQTNGGISMARNTGTQAARGEYIAFLDSDDLWAPQKLAVQFASLQSYGKPAFSFTDFRVFDELGVHRRSGLLTHQAFRKTAKFAGRKNDRGDLIIVDDGRKPVLPDCYIQPSSSLVRRADIIAIGGFDASIPVSEDYDFFLRLFKIVPAVAVMESLMLYRRHANQETSNAIKFKLAQFDIAQRMAAAPQKYPVGDVIHMGSTDFLRYYRLGMEQARGENFVAAIHSFKQSLAARPTVRAGAALVGAWACRTAPGHQVFIFVRAIWKYVDKR